MIIEPTLPEHGPAQMRSLTSRSRMRPITFRCSAAVYFGIQGETDLRTNPINAEPGSPSIDRICRPLPPDDRSNVSTHRDLQHALAAERVRIRHMCKALACTEDDNLRQRWQSEMADSLARVREIEQTLRVGASPAEQHAADMVDECLLEAMELARANGDSRAAEIVAMECMALVEMRCMRIQQGSIGQAAAFVPENEGIHYKEQNHEKYQ
jgi:hypothetical protein